MKIKKSKLTIVLTISIMVVMLGAGLFAKNYYEQNDPEKCTSQIGDDFIGPNGQVVTACP